MLHAILIPAVAAIATTGTIGARVGDGPDPTIRITLNSEGRYLPGDRVRVQVRTRDDGYVVVFQVDPDQRVKVLFPLDPTDDNYIRGGKNYTLLGRGGREGFMADAGGTGTIFAAVSQDPWRFEQVTVNQHWDYRTLNATVYDDPEPQLVELAQRLAGGRYEYDILQYSVLSNISHSSTGTVIADDSYYSSGCFDCGGSSTVISIGFGVGYSTWGLYDPYYYDPFYWNRWYGPWYPVTWYPYPGYGWGYPNYPYYPAYPVYPAYPYYPPGPVYGGSPYRFKDWNRQWSGGGTPYRDRWTQGSLAARNTVAGPVSNIGVTQRAGFRDRSWSGGSAGTPVGAGRAVNVPVSRAGGTANGGGRRVDPSSKASTPKHIDGGYVGPRRTSKVESPGNVPVTRSSREPTGSEDRPTNTFTAPTGRRVEAKKADNNRPPVSRVDRSSTREGQPELRRRESQQPAIERTEPSRAESKRPEPSRTEPSRPEPRKAEPQRSEPQRSEPQRAEPKRSEPSRGSGSSQGGSNGGSRGGAVAPQGGGRSSGGGFMSGGGGGGSRPSGGGAQAGGRRR